MQETGELLPTLRAFIIALGHYAFATDFVFFVTDEEESFVQSLQQKDKLSADEVILLSTYAPLYKIPTLNYDAPQNDTDFDDLIRVQIHEPLQERALIETIKCYKPLQDEVSQKVRAQYEENPYPRWRRGYKMMVADITGEQERLNRRLGHILIAGCGTGQQIVNVATSSPNAHITAIDLSLSSIGYAKRKIDEFGLSHRVDFMQADILTLGDMDMRFDSVECAGVLHHMDDPMAGWRVLRSLLKPNGLMPIGLYSEMARQNIVQCRAEIAQMGLGNDAKSIRAYRDILRKRAAGDDLDEAMTGLFHSKDLFSLSECRDLLFHVQEHRFTIPQLKSCLEELDLEFLGFNLSYNLECLFTNLYPDPKDLVNLEAWHIAEQKNPLLFAAMYQFWCIAR
jgi:2-polyprenyl-3-methyl-5-hydroxy-6-metoxy-1,4-benzoquinol methylase